MDANNTRFHLLLGRNDWEPLLNAAGDSGLSWDEERAAVSLRPHLFRFRANLSDPILAHQTRRGAARDVRGNWYWISDGDYEIRTLPAGSDRSRAFWSASESREQPERRGAFRPVPTGKDPAAPKLRGLAVTDHQFLVVGVPEPASLLVFDLHRGGPPARIAWPIPFAPLEIAPAPGGGVWILEDGKEPRFWALDRHFRVGPGLSRSAQAPEPGVFRPADGADPVEAPRVLPIGVAPEAAFPLPVSRPVAMEPLPDGSILILNAGGRAVPSTVSRYRYRQALGEARLELPAGMVENEDRPCLLHGYDLAFQPSSPPGESPVAGTLYVLTHHDSHAFAFALVATETELTLEPLPRQYPVRWGGKGIIADRRGAWYENDEQWLPLKEQRRIQYDKQGVLTTGPLDGKEPGCVWHRLFLDAVIPSGTAIQVLTRTAETPADLEELHGDEGWREEPAPCLRPGGSELPYHDPFSPEEIAGHEGVGTWETLLQGARGRYLQVRLILNGTGRSSPRIRALRTYYPRFSYLTNYMPALYREDQASASFLERFLANVEGLYTALEDRIAQAQILFDPRSVPADYLEWLANWMALVLDPGWEEVRRRLFLLHAHRLFAARGTLPGIVWAIRLATDPYPTEGLFDEEIWPYVARTPEEAQELRLGGPPFRIVEQYLTRFAPGAAYGLQLEPGTTAAEQEAHHRDTLLYQRYLALQYATVDRMNEAYDLTGTEAFANFNAVTLPGADAEGEMNEARRRDWTQFRTTYIPFIRCAHRFTVYLPTVIYGTGEVQGLDPDVVSRVLLAESPAHTDFEVKRFWATLEVGESRLGQDTLVDAGSRVMVLAHDVLHPYQPDRQEDFLEKGTGRWATSIRARRR